MVVQFERGETRHIKLEVYSIRGDEFTIQSAAYELVNGASGETEDSGVASILEHILDVVVSPKSSGGYRLQFSYQIADESIVDTVYISVGE